MAEDPAVTEAVIGASRKGKTSLIRRLGSQIRSLQEKLDRTKVEIANLTDVAAKLGVEGFTETLRKRVASISREQDEILAEMHSLKREQTALKDERNYRTQVQQGLRNFAKVVRKLSEAEQRELVRLIVDAIVIAPVGPCSSGSKTRRLSMVIYLRMGALVKSNEQDGKKLKVTLSITLHRSKAIWARTAGMIELEVRRPELKVKPRRSSRKHEILRADDYQREMDREGRSAANGARLSHLSIGCTAPKAGETPALPGNHLLIRAPLRSAAELARRKGVSLAAVAQVLRWHRLSPSAQTLLRELTDQRLLRLCSRQFLDELLDVPKRGQVSALKRRLGRES